MKETREKERQESTKRKSWSTNVQQPHEIQNFCKKKSRNTHVVNWSLFDLRVGSATRNNLGTNTHTHTPARQKQERTRPEPSKPKTPQNPYETSDTKHPSPLTLLAAGDDQQKYPGEAKMYFCLSQRFFGSDLLSQAGFCRTVFFFFDLRAVGSFFFVSRFFCGATFFGSCGVFSSINSVLGYFFGRGFLGTVFASVF